MTFAAVWALLGLLALPLVWWFHKQLRRPPEVALPSLIFVQDEADAHTLPRGRRLDAELLLALAATALLALAAAGPSLVQTQPQRVVRVVLRGGGAAGRPAYVGAVEATLASVRSAVDESDRVDVRWVPAAPWDGFHTKAPSVQALLAAAGAGPASARIVISDRPAPDAAAGVIWVAVGDAGTTNLGIVGVAVLAGSGGPELFVTLAWHGPHPVRGRLDVAPQRALVFGAKSVPFEIPADGHASVRVPLEGLAGADLTVALGDARGDLWEDDLAHDDEIALRHGPAVVFADGRLPEELVVRLELALRAALGEGGFRLVRRRSEAGDASLAVVPRGRARALAAALVLEVEPLAEGAPAERAPPGIGAPGRGPIARDLSSGGADWVYAAGAAHAADGEEVLLARRAGRRAWPVLLRAGRRVRLAPDPLRGAPRPVDTALWPLLVENLVRAGGGAGVGGGYRATGLLDDESTRPGRASTPLDPARVASAAPSEPGRSRPLRPLLIVAALACLGLLWAAPRLRRALAARARARANPHARPA